MKKALHKRVQLLDLAYPSSVMSASRGASDMADYEMHTSALWGTKSRFETVPAMYATALWGTIQSTKENERVQ